MQEPHYSDVMISAVSSEITGVSIVCPAVCSGADQRKDQCSASLDFMRGIYRSPVDSPKKGPVTRKYFHLMTSSWITMEHGVEPLARWGRGSLVIYTHRSLFISWWRHQMETFSALLALCAGNSTHKGQWHGALKFSLICTWINGWVNNGEAGDLRRHRTHYHVTVMWYGPCKVVLIIPVMIDNRPLEATYSSARLISYLHKRWQCLPAPVGKTVRRSKPHSHFLPAASIRIDYWNQLHKFDIYQKSLRSIKCITWVQNIFITVTSLWARWRLKSPASRVFAQPFVQAQIKEITKAPRHRPLWRESTDDRCFPPHKVPVTRKMFPFDNVTMLICIEAHRRI